MHEQTTLIPQVRRTLAARSVDWGTVLATLLVAAVALPLRLVGLRDFATIDEVAHWVERTARFSDGLANGRLLATHQTGHPGVTLMWLASLGRALAQQPLAAGWSAEMPELVYLAWLRLPPAFLQSLLIPVGYLLLRRLVAPPTALLAALLWASAPFLVAHGRLLHLDGLLTTFVTISLLLVLVATLPDSATAQRGLVAASGFCAGLAVLTKAPALILLPAVGLLLLWRVSGSRLIVRLGRAITCFALWLGTAALTVLLLYPALWVDPGRVLHSYTEEIVDNGGRPNGAGQFFLGRAVDDPGPLFYLVTSLLRTTPLTLLGLSLALALGLAALLRRMPSPVAATVSNERQTVSALALFALLWFAVMTLGPKKFDRYVLPAWPALEVLAAWGLTQTIGYGLQASSRFWPQPRQPTNDTNNLQSSIFNLQSILAVALVAMFQLPLLVWYHPYYLSYYNPLLGGGKQAERWLLIGWGEGMDQVGAFLRTQPDLTHGPVLSALEPTLQPFLPVPVKSVTDLDRGDQNYAVIYLESVQRGANAALYDSIRRTLPLHTVTIHGIDYAQIYQLPRPFEQPLEARFGEGLHIWGVTIERQPGQLLVTPAWDVRMRPHTDLLVFLHLIDAQGRQVAQIDVAPGGTSMPPTSQWQAGRQVAVPLPLPLPLGLAPGSYELTMGLYEPTTGQRLPLRAGPVADPIRAGPDALLVATISLP